MTNRKIISAEVKDWRGHDPDTACGISCEFEDGMIVGMGIGTRPQAEAAARQALERGEEFVRETFAANGSKWVP